ncbi:MAG: peptide-methionine (R)-S-oxide reductase MsrB [Pelagimonas sp.]|uniref:peptide-methionine (R)-S-oxide reductase MsrB n=1 Tax=Pelagimonas sp. TaxID=2073170 RepID=UPI003D6BC5E0
MNRRRFFTALSAAVTATLASRPAWAAQYEVTRSDAQWRAMLSNLQYKVMRAEGTERAFSSPLNDEKRTGTFTCRGCDLALYASKDKFDSGTGWPSFVRSIPNAIGTKTDRKLFMTRTECHCRRCGSHLGHIFDDGPAPTGKRHCINGVSLKFVAA